MNTQAEIWNAHPEALRVLLVEDNPGDARLLKEVLGEFTGASLQLEWAECLSAGLERLAAGGIDVALLDLSLPDSTGLGTLAKMQAAAPHLAIIVLTGLDDEALAIRAVREGAQDYLVKGQVDSNLLARSIGYAIARKRGQEALRQSEEKYRTLIENIQDGVFVIQDGKIRFANEGFARMVGYTAEELVGMDLSQLVWPEDRELLADVCCRGQPGEDMPTEYQFRMLHKDKKSRVIVNMIVGLIAYRGGMANMGMVKDITERKRAEEEKQQLQEQLAQAQKMQALGTLAGGIAHEFNNINAAVIGYIDFTLQTEELSSSARRNLEIVRSSAVRGADLTKSLLAFSQKVVGERKPLNLRDIVDEVLMVTEKEFSSEGIEVTVRHSMKVPPVMGDRGLLSQVVMNLIINARHAMLKSPAKRLTVQTGLGRGRPFIRVKDTGCGIAKENTPRVFEPFFTTKGSLASGGVYDGKVRGTGLGLSVCHSIVDGHGGEIKVRSQVGKGTTFTVYLLPASKSERMGQEGNQERSAGGRRIMVVDDERDIAELLVQILGRAGYGADGFTSPKQALRALRHGRYSLAFIDLQMPEMPGEDFIGMIDDLPPEGKPLKVILTGRVDDPQEQYAHLGAFATLHKPFSNQEVLGIVEEGLAARTTAAGQMGEKVAGAR